MERHGPKLGGGPAACPKCAIKDEKSVQSKKHAACGNQHTACNGRESYPLAQKYGCENNNENDAELIHRRNPRGLTELECAKVAHPGQTSSQSGQYKKCKSLAADPGESGNRNFGKGDAPREEEHHSSPNRRGQIGINIGHSQFGENRGSGGE